MQIDVRIAFYVLCKTVLVSLQQVNLTVENFNFFATSSNFTLVWTAPESDEWKLCLLKLNIDNSCFNTIQESDIGKPLVVQLGAELCPNKRPPSLVQQDQFYHIHGVPYFKNVTESRMCGENHEDYTVMGMPTEHLKISLQPTIYPVIQETCQDYANLVFQLPVEYSRTSMRDVVLTAPKLILNGSEIQTNENLKLTPRRKFAFLTISNLSAATVYEYCLSKSFANTSFSTNGYFTTDSEVLKLKLEDLRFGERNFSVSLLADPGLQLSAISIFANSSIENSTCEYQRNLTLEDRESFLSQQHLSMDILVQCDGSVYKNSTDVVVRYTACGVTDSLLWPDRVQPSPSPSISSREISSMLFGLAFGIPGAIVVLLMVGYAVKKIRKNITLRLRHSMLSHAHSLDDHRDLILDLDPEV